MALKFLNKKGWHTGSLRNIENVWKAEQKHEAEQRKLEELRKQILEERERDEFRLLQEQAGITPRQERLEFLYDSGLAVGKTSSDGFKAIETYPGSDNSASVSESVPASGSSSGLAQSSLNQAAVPGALFEDKPQSANDAWRKLHTDPLLMIRQREQEALARIKNNPVKMAMIRKSVESKKHGNSHEEEHQKVKLKHKKHSSSKRHSDSESDSHEGRERKRKMKHRKERPSDSDSDSEKRERRRKVKNKKKEHYSDAKSDSDGERERRRKLNNKREEQLDSDEDSRDKTRHHRHSHRDYESEKKKSDRAKDSERTQRGYEEHYSDSENDLDGERERRRKLMNKKEERLEYDEDSRDRTKHHRHSHKDYESEKKKSDRTKDIERTQRGYEKSKYEEYRSDRRSNKIDPKAFDDVRSHQVSDSQQSDLPPKHDSYRRRGRAPQLTEEERAARLREMQMDAEVHEEQRWKRLKKADEDDAREASQAGNSRGKSFLHSVQKSVYGAEKGGSSTIEESVRRRTHFLQGRTADEGNAFRR